jgi:hypothetical protein
MTFPPYDPNRLIAGRKINEKTPASFHWSGFLLSVGCFRQVLIGFVSRAFRTSRKAPAGKGTRVQTPNHR